MEEVGQEGKLMTEEHVIVTDGGHIYLDTVKYSINTLLARMISNKSS